jgi:hypothetical protein
MIMNNFKMKLITALSFAVENVGDTILRAFFHASSFSTVKLCSKGPDMPSIVF